MPPKKPRLWPFGRPRRSQNAGTPPAVGGVTGAFGGVWPDGFEPLGVLGSGGSATVHAARRASDGARVAVKIIDPPAGGSFDVPAERRVRLDAARRMQHPSVAATLDVLEAGACLAVVMEHVPGRTLSDALEDGPLDLTAVAALGVDLAGGLAAVHYAGLLHLDVKPENILLTGGTPAAVLLDVAPAGAADRPVTPAYTAPERVGGGTVGPPADVYALGLVLYEAATGVATFRGQGDAVLHQQQVRTPPEPGRLRPDLPPEVGDLIVRMIAKDPSERPRLDAVQAALTAFAPTQPGAGAVPGDRVDALLGGTSPQFTRLSLTPDGGQLRASFQTLEAGSRLGGAVGVAWTPSGRSVVAYRGAPHGPGGVVLPRPAGRLGVPPARLDVPDPQQLSLAPGGGDVFVLDGAARAVLRFTPSGRPVGQVGPVPAGVGRLLKPVAFSRTPDGRTFVLDVGRNLVYAYAPDGRYERAFGLQGASDAQPRPVAGMTSDDAGRLWLVDTRARRLRTLTPGGALESSTPLPDGMNPAGGRVLVKPTRGLVLLGVQGEPAVWAVRRDGGPPVLVRLPGPLTDLPAD